MNENTTCKYVIIFFLENSLPYIHVTENTLLFRFHFLFLRSSRIKIFLRGLMVKVKMLLTKKTEGIGVQKIFQPAHYLCNPSSFTPAWYKISHLCCYDISQKANAL